ncbi:MAG: tRNA uridine-5-carboxymethylaminomethyl(34) synthesis enzyme MnmG [Spirochaetaceae bacterium]|nr:MAG: tRNA uridine-5-carboxymethylaminomethyl(34) synthesis enzyme MnmG [Spirochaetaceae bacterium]
MDFDAIVVGGGHAGIEAALAVARLDFSVLMITQNLDCIGKLSCNPAVGGLAKGNMVREIDALGGQMGRLIDATMIQFRVLNRSRGPAVQAPRAQADKLAYQTLAKQTLEQQKNLVVFQDTVVDFILDEPGRQVQGVVTERKRRFRAPKVIVTTGTFLNGRIYIGEFCMSAGRLGEPAAAGLEEGLRRVGFTLGRLKTGTPARVHRESLDFDRMEPQFGDQDIVPFSFSHDSIDRPRLPCYITFTNEKTHRILADNMHRSPLYSGRIVGHGARYCPSIEDKVVKFPDRTRHQIFVEPEGLQTAEMYLNGVSTSMPEDVQQRFIHTIAGMEHAWIMRPGYAVEYDYIDPSQLFASLECKMVRGLYVAGQTNGSSGYEEAAGQGLIAGINAARALQGKQPLILSRAEAYIGVMIDDLVTLGTDEPYRMFTSRAEHRLSLRHDSSDMRLVEIGREAGLVGDRCYERFLAKRKGVEEIKELLQKRRVSEADIAELRALADRAEGRAPRFNGRFDLDGCFGKSFHQMLKVPEISLIDLTALDSVLAEPRPVEWLRQVELDVKYEGYVARQDRQVDRFRRMERMKIPHDYDYDSVTGISSESREKFKRVRPLSVGQAARISGVRNSDIAILLVSLGRWARQAG